MKEEEMLNLIHDLKTMQTGQQKKVAELLEELEKVKEDNKQLTCANMYLEGQVEGIKSICNLLFDTKEEK